MGRGVPNDDAIGGANLAFQVVVKATDFVASRVERQGARALMNGKASGRRCQCRCWSKSGGSGSLTNAVMQRTCSHRERRVCCGASSGGILADLMKSMQQDSVWQRSDGHRDHQSGQAGTTSASAKQRLAVTAKSAQELVERKVIGVRTRLQIWRSV